ncbi:AMP-dependent synthetase/ligase [Actinotignum sp. GS-2025c]|uniref:AMP-dependent synthetase/ligase n=1 Tax=Actinotignum sp. GS-2025c TaxID=3427276 RepID=UPI003F4857E1
MKKHRDGSLSQKAPFKNESYHTVPWLLAQRQRKHPRDIAVHIQSSIGGNWKPLTITEFLEQVRLTARGLIGLGLGHGERIGILAATSYEWALLDAAALHIGVVPVPIYETSSAKQIAWMVADAQITHIFTDTRAHAELVDSVTPPAIPPATVMTEDWRAALNAAALDVPEEDLDARIAAVTADSLATIIYTSGTTGDPKGVELTHGNFARTVLGTWHYEPEILNNPQASLLLFLPMAHVMGRICAYFGLATRISVGFVGNLKNLMSDLETFKPTLLLVVPRVLEKVYNAAEAKAGAGLRRRIFRWAADIAVQNGTRRRRSPIFAVKRALARKLVFNKLREAMGGRIRFAISAGAPLGTRLGRFYRGIGLTVVEGYGLTETTGPANATRAANPVLGTVGWPLPGMRIKLADDGEVLVKGHSVFRGYHNNPEATAAAFADGWFHTGDLGTLDKRGNLTITGRKKHLIVTAGGKNVAPAVLEDKLSSHPLISNVVVLGDGEPFISALITLDAQMLPSWLSSHGLPKMSPAEAMNSEAVNASLQRAIDRTNAQVSRAESIRKFVIVPGDFSEANGLLTPSLKVRREVVLERYRDVVDGIYGANHSESTKKSEAKERRRAARKERRVQRRLERLRRRGERGGRGTAGQLGERSGQQSGEPAGGEK